MSSQKEQSDGSRWIEGKKQVREAFTTACWYGENMNIIKHLLKHPDFDPSVNDNRAIRWASSNGHLEIVTHLLKLDPDLNRKNEC